MSKDIDFPAPTPGSWGMTSVSHPTYKAALLAPPFPRHCFTIVGYKTPEQVRAFFAGDRTLFDDIEEWLDDNLPEERSMSAQGDFYGSLHVAIPGVADAVTFKLAWGEVILP